MMRSAAMLGFRGLVSRRGWLMFGLRLFLGMVTIVGVASVVMAANVVKAENGRGALFYNNDVVNNPANTVTRHHSYKNRRVFITLVEQRAVSSMPGLSAELPPGTVRFSPALASQVESDPKLGRWFPYTKLPDLGSDTLDTGGTFRAYIGVPDGSLNDTEFSQGLFAGEYRSFETRSLIGFILFAVAPALALLAVSARLDTERSEATVRSLRLVGMSPLGSRIPVIVSVAVPSFVGAVFSLILYSIVIPTVFRLPVSGRYVFAQDAELSSTQSLMAVGLVGIVASLWALTTGSGMGSEPVARIKPRRRLGLGAYAIGLLLAIALAVRAQSSDPLRIVMVIAVSIGLPSAVTAVSSKLSSLPRRDMGPIPVHLALRKLAQSPAAQTRIVGLLAVVMFASLCSGAVSPSDDVISSSQLNIVIPDGPKAVTATNLSSSPFHSKYGSIGTVHITMESPVEGPALVVDCQAQQALKLTSNGCLNDVTAMNGAKLGESIHLDGGQTLIIKDELMIPASHPASDGGSTPVIIPLGLLTGSTELSPRVLATPPVLNAIQANVIAENPLDTLNDYRNFDPIPSWILAGLMFATVIAMLGAVMSTLAATEELPQIHNLRIAGAGTGTLLQSALVTSLITSTVAATLALTPAVLLIHSVALIQGEKTIIPATRILLIAILAALAIVFSLATRAVQLASYQRTNHV